MVKNDFDWSYFKRRIYIKNTTIKDLFNYWTTPDGLTSFFIKEAVFTSDNGIIRKHDEIIQVNDQYKWIFHNGSTVKGVILDVKKNKHLKFTFGEKKPGSDENVIVTVTIFENDNGAGFDILQENMATSKYGKVMSYLSCNMGWVFHMNNLKLLIENGHDLRIHAGSRMHVDAPSAYPLEDYKWTEFHQKEYIRAPIEDVFKKWVTADGITSWFIGEAEYFDKDGTIRKSNECAQTGDLYRWKFYSGIEIRGKIIEVIKNSIFMFTFGKKEPDSDEDVLVRVSLSRDGDITKIAIKQSNISDTEYGHITFNMSCNIGWSYFLTNLRSLFESGYDLRENDQLIAQETRIYSLKM